MRHVIIERPDLQSPLKRAGTRGITLIFWIFWIYLWTPIISLVAWLLGVHLFRKNIIDNGGYQFVLESVFMFFAIVLVMAAIFIGWGLYNQKRFRGKELRKAPMPIDLVTHASDFKTNPEQLAAWQASKHLVVQHDKQGHITNVVATPFVELVQTESAAAK
jgi:biofilm PGA synthesis protein PgaD